MAVFWGVVCAVGALAATGLIGWHVGRWRKARRAKEVLQLARGIFRRRREWLEAEFVTRASERGKPRDFAWAGCEFADAVAFARDRSTGQLRALVEVTICFEAEDGVALDGGEAGVAVRLATAVFRFEKDMWTSDGRAIFNLNPAETIRRYQHELEVVD